MNSNMYLKLLTSKKKEALLFAVFMTVTVYILASLDMTQCSLVQLPPLSRNIDELINYFLRVA